MRHGEEVERDATEIDVAAALDLAELGCTDAELGKLALDKTECQLAREDGHLVVEVLQQVRKRTGVVLVAVGDDDAAELLLVLQDIRVVGKHQVDTGLGVVGEHEAGVDEHHVVAALEDRHILADAVKAAERMIFKGDDFLAAIGECCFLSTKRVWNNRRGASGKPTAGNVQKCISESMQ